MIGWRKDGTYTHLWLFKRQISIMNRPSLDTKQLRYCTKYYRRQRNKPKPELCLRMCTYPYLKK